MSVFTPTVLPRPQVFPHLLPKPPQPYPTPLPTRRVYEHLNSRRDIQREMDDLSDEENELEDIVIDAYTSWHVPSASELVFCRSKPSVPEGTAR
jgi:uncharacterized protein YjiS (DUF1127 family)